MLGPQKELVEWMLNRVNLYPISYVLADALAEQTPPELQYLIKDLFYDITFFSNGTTEATARKRNDGTYALAAQVEAHKFKADDQGNETEVPVNDWIEVGALAAPDKGKKYGAVLHRERVDLNAHTGTYTFVSGRLPENAGGSSAWRQFEEGDCPVNQNCSAIPVLHQYQPLPADRRLVLP